MESKSDDNGEDKGGNHDNSSLKEEIRQKIQQRKIDDLETNQFNDQQERSNFPQTLWDAYHAYKEGKIDENTESQTNKQIVFLLRNARDVKLLGIGISLCGIFFVCISVLPLAFECFSPQAWDQDPACKGLASFAIFFIALALGGYLLYFREKFIVDHGFLALGPTGILFQKFRKAHHFRWPEVSDIFLEGGSLKFRIHRQLYKFPLLILTHHTNLSVEKGFLLFKDYWLKGGGKAIVETTVKSQSIDKKLGMKKKANSPRNAPHPQRDTPLPEKLHKFKQTLEWLQLIPRLQRVNIAILAKILRIDDHVLRELLPPVAQEFGVGIDGDYIRLPTTVNDLIRALKQVFSQWNEVAQTQLEVEDLPSRRINAWLSILGEILIGSKEFKRGWVADILDIELSELDELLVEFGSTYGMNPADDMIIVETPAMTSAESMSKREEELMQLGQDQLEFIDQINIDLTRNAKGKKKEKNGEKGENLA